MEKEKILNALKKLREISKKRNFDQSVDLIIVLRNINLKDPKMKINSPVLLPHGSGKDKNVVVFSDSIKSDKFEVVDSKKIEEIGKDKKTAKKFTKSLDFGLSEPKLMTLVGRYLGRYLSPRGKMPQIITDMKNVEQRVNQLRKSVRVRIKDSPVIQCKIGKESMKDEEIAENVLAIINFVIQHLPEGKANIKKVYLKFTMSDIVEVA